MRVCRCRDSSGAFWMTIQGLNERKRVMHRQRSKPHQIHGMRYAARWIGRSVTAIPQTRIYFALMGRAVVWRIRCRHWNQEGLVPGRTCLTDSRHQTAPNALKTAGFLALDCDAAAGTVSRRAYTCLRVRTRSGATGSVSIATISSFGWSAAGMSYWLAAVGSPAL